MARVVVRCSGASRLSLAADALACAAPGVAHTPCRARAPRKAKAIELMVVDAMLEADAELRISERFDDPELFVTLDDTLLRQIETHGLLPDLARPAARCPRLHLRTWRSPLPACTCCSRL